MNNLIFKNASWDYKEYCRRMDIVSEQYSRKGAYIMIYDPNTAELEGYLFGEVKNNEKLIEKIGLASEMIFEIIRTKVNQSTVISSNENILYRKYGRSIKGKNFYISVIGFNDHFKYDFLPRVLLQSGELSDEEYKKIMAEDEINKKLHLTTM